MNQTDLDNPIKKNKKMNMIKINLPKHLFKIFQKDVEISKKEFNF